MFFAVFLHQRNHEVAGAFAAVLGSITKFSLQKVASQTIEAKKRMIAMRLVMVIEAFTFLMPVGIKKR